MREYAPVGRGDREHKVVTSAGQGSALDLYPCLVIPTDLVCHTMTGAPDKAGQCLFSLQLSVIRKGELPRVRMPLTDRGGS